MPLDLTDRRTFLGGLTGVVAGLAGCPLSDSDEADQPTADTRANPRTGAETRTASQTSIATETSTASPPEETEDAVLDQDQIPPHDHSGADAGGSVLAPVDFSAGNFQQPQTYVVFKRDGEIHALHGATQEIVFSGPDATPVLQNVVGELDAGTILVKRGTYRMGPGELTLSSDVRLVGEGIGSTVFKLKDGINGRRGQNRSTVVSVPEGVRDVTIADLEIDGNESNNRGVPPYPQSPHHHGIMIHGSGPQVPTADKPANVTVRNVSVHDTVRSNIVLAGYNCTLENIQLANSASDHWLYMGGAEECTVTDVHASGFARNSGIVFGVGKRICRDNTIRDLTITDATETPYQSDPEGIGGRYPKIAVNFRPSSGFASRNTLEDVTIRSSTTDFGHSIGVMQPETTITNLTYDAELGRRVAPVLNVGSNGAATTVTDANIEVGATAGFDKHYPLVSITASDVTINRSRVTDGPDGALRGVAIDTGADPTRRVTVRDTKIRTSGPALTAVGNTAPVESLYVENLQDVSGAGVDVNGEVTFSNRMVVSG